MSEMWERSEHPAGLAFPYDAGAQLAYDALVDRGHNPADVKAHLEWYSDLWGSFLGPVIDQLEATLKVRDDGREVYERRQKSGNRALALVDEGDAWTAARDVISNVLTAVIGDPRIPANEIAAKELLDVSHDSYLGDAEDYDWRIEE